VEREFKIINTEDGSNSIFVPSLKETYHSKYGAVTESQYVFIQEGLNFYLNNNIKSEVNILEVGFGTGLNALLTLVFCELWNFPVSYTTLEPFPLGLEITSKLNFCNNQLLLRRKEQFQSIHGAEWECEVEISKNFKLTKTQKKLEAFKSAPQFDLIYFDAFAPAKQPEVWDIDVLEHATEMLIENGMLVTYCASRQFRRNLIRLGLEVEVLKGPPGKLEMVRAIKS
jgi:tRNA U34 5-methylaminomethyl-2-thiouridine-forming methyltransferase MnmC